jgi:hypothetical protein
MTKLGISVGILATVFCHLVGAQTISVLVLDQAGAQTVLQAAKESAQKRNAPSKRFSRLSAVSHCYIAKSTPAWCQHPDKITTAQSQINCPSGQLLFRCRSRIEQKRSA